MFSGQNHSVYWDVRARYDRCKRDSGCPVGRIAELRRPTSLCLVGLELSGLAFSRRRKKQ